MNQLALLWADGLKHVHPEATLDVAMFESGQVLPKLGAGEMEIGLMSRPLTESELKQGGIVAIATAPGRGALAIIRIVYDAPSASPTVTVASSCAA